MTTVPVLGAQKAVLFPGMRCEVLLSTPRALAAVQTAIDTAGGAQIAVFATRGSSPTDQDDLHGVGTLARIVNLGVRSCCRRWFTQLLGQQRVRCVEHVRADPFREARVEQLVEAAGQAALLSELSIAVRRAVVALHARKPRCQHARRAHAAIAASPDVHALVGAVADLLAHLPFEQLQELLETEPLSAQLQLALAHLHGLQAQLDHDGASAGASQSVH